MANPRFNKQVAQPRVSRKGGGMGGRTGEMMYSRGYGMGMKSKRKPTELMDRGAMKKGGKVGKKMRKKGAKGAPKASDFKRAKQTARS